MAPDSSDRAQVLEPEESVMRWLLDSDPSIRWQVMRDLTGATAEDIAAERARIAAEGAGARLLALQAGDGRWGGTAWNRGWNSTMHALMLLRDLGLDPMSDPARRAVGHRARRAGSRPAHWTQLPISLRFHITCSAGIMKA